MAGVIGSGGGGSTGGAAVAAGVGGWGLGVRGVTPVRRSFRQTGSTALLSEDFNSTHTMEVCRARARV